MAHFEEAEVKFARSVVDEEAAKLARQSLVAPREQEPSHKGRYHSGAAALRQSGLFSQPARYPEGADFSAEIWQRPYVVTTSRSTQPSSQKAQLAKPRAR